MARKPYNDVSRVIDYRAVFGTDTGRRVLTDILVKGNVFAPIVPTDPIAAARMEGARHLALHIASFIKFDASSFMDAWKDPKDV